MIATKIGPNCIQTYTGREFNPFDPDPDSIEFAEFVDIIRRAYAPSDEYVRDAFLEMFRVYGGRS